MKSKKRLSDIIADSTGIELPDSCITVNDGCEVSLSGCERISAYEVNRIAVCLKRNLTAEILGEGLELDTYMTDRAVIRGRIDSVRFVREGKGECEGG